MLVHVGFQDPDAAIVVADYQVDRLRCEYLENPLGIDQPIPRLSWITHVLFLESA